MKVLVYIPCLLIGDTEIQTLNLVCALVEGRHEVVTAWNYCLSTIKRITKR